MIFFVGEKEYGPLFVQGGTGMVIKLVTFYGVPFAPTSASYLYRDETGEWARMPIRVETVPTVALLVRAWSVVGGLGFAVASFFVYDGSRAIVGAVSALALGTVVFFTASRGLLQREEDKQVRVVALDVLGHPIDPRWLTDFGKQRELERVARYLAEPAADAADRLKAEIIASLLNRRAADVTPQLEELRKHDARVASRARLDADSLARHPVALPDYAPPPVRKPLSSDLGWVQPLPIVPGRARTRWPLLGVVLVPAGVASMLAAIWLHTRAIDPFLELVVWSLQAGAGAMVFAGLFLLVAGVPLSPRRKRAATWALPGFILAAGIGAFAGFALGYLS